ncbi:hypothetical protein GY45DRAFT_248798 [Cubamyces sp. BRFM 1775]|nr:hypothetical protein GY45DRAFT_248798 [Cubamyces sp. BRFM 1775]
MAEGVACHSGCRSKWAPSVNLTYIPYMHSVGRVASPDSVRRTYHHNSLPAKHKPMFTRLWHTLISMLRRIIPWIHSERAADGIEGSEVVSPNGQDSEEIDQIPTTLPVPSLAAAVTSGGDHLTVLLDFLDPTQTTQTPSDTDVTAIPLSWSRIFRHLGLEPEVDILALESGQRLSLMEVDVRNSDPHYLLYLDCLRYLRDEYPQPSLSGCIPDAMSVNWLKGRPECFGTLVNVLVDIMPWMLVRAAYANNQPLDVHAVAAPGGTLSWIVFAILAMQLEGTRRGPHWHASCTCQALQHTTIHCQATLDDSDLYQALFLDCLISRWIIEFATRESSVFKSPMPWSPQSRQEPLALVPITLCSSALTDSDIPDEDGGLVRAAQRRFGCPLDIPWLDGHHDGYEISTNLSSYTYIRRPLGHTYSLRHDTALWIGAMTFGLLEAISGMRLLESTLLVPNDSGPERILSGMRLLRFMAYWESALRRDEPSHLEHGRQVVALLCSALEALEEEVLLEQAGTATLIGFPAGTKPEVLFSVAVAIISLSVLVTSDPQWNVLPEMEPLHAFLRLEAYATVTALAAFQHGRAKMVDAGWCAHTVYNLHDLIALRYPYVVSTLMRLPPFVKCAQDEHANCRDDSCALYTITDEDAYTPHHVDSSCQCDYVRPPLGDVTELLANGIVPVIVYEELSGLRVLPASSNEVKYVAISHVWAEGMGSTTEKGLPTCVVQRIAGLVRQILPGASRPPAFWMDSLCVPSARNERKRAIMLMAQTYKDATKVLVVDDCIRSMCSTRLPWQQNFLRIASSAWVHRVWTLQEGLLARDLCFEFAEGPVDVEENVGMKDRSTPPASEGPLQELSHYIPIVPVLAFRARPPRPFAEVPFSEVVGLLSGRSTTKAEDELVAISTLLPSRVDVSRLLEIERGGDDLLPTADRRMMSFLLQLREIPRAVPFGSAPRLDVPGFKWAPRTLVEDSPGAWTERDGTGIFTGDGFVTEYIVLPLKLHPSAATSPPDIQPDESDGRWQGTIYGPVAGHVYSLTADTTLLCDALLLGGTADVARLSTSGDPVPCFAVSYCGSPGGISTEPEGGWSQETPCQVRYVQRCGLVRHSPMEEDFFLNRRDKMGGVLGEPSGPRWLKLT